MKKVCDLNSPSRESWTRRVVGRTCGSVEHNPPNVVGYEPGVYEHECPECCPRCKEDGDDDAA